MNQLRKSILEMLNNDGECSSETVCDSLKAAGRKVNQLDVNAQLMALEMRGAVSSEVNKDDDFHFTITAKGNRLLAASQHFAES